MNHPLANVRGTLVRMHAEADANVAQYTRFGATRVLAMWKARRQALEDAIRVLDLEAFRAEGTFAYNRTRNADGSVSF